MNKLVCHLDWGLFGVQKAVKREDLIIIADVLSFSTSTAIAIKNDAVIFPSVSRIDATDISREFDAEISVRRRDVPSLGNYSLSPSTYYEIRPGTKVALVSPNGAVCTRETKNTGTVFCGAIVNCSAVAEVSFNEAVKKNQNITVIACGEKIHGTKDPYHIRMAVEDYLGAGTILAKIPLPKTPEAVVCENAYLKVADHIQDIIWKCESGIELREMNFGNDIHIAASINSVTAVPVYRDGFYQNYNKVISIDR